MATTISGSTVALGWQQMDAAQFTGVGDIVNAVVDEQTWIAVVGAFNQTITFDSNITSSSQCNQMLPTTLP